MNPMALFRWRVVAVTTLTFLVLSLISGTCREHARGLHSRRLHSEFATRENNPRSVSVVQGSGALSTNFRLRTLDDLFAQNQFAHIGARSSHVFGTGYSTNAWTSIRSRTEGFSNAAGWNWESLYTTLHTVTSNGLYYVLGRGACGMRVMKVGQDGTIITVNDCGIPFSNDNGWSVNSYFSTIRVTVLNDVIYVTGRGNCGLYIYKIVDDTPELVNECEIKFSDENGWNVEKYYSTLRVVAANGELYISARGSCGMYVFKLYEDQIHTVNVCKIPFSDETGWNSTKYYATIRTVTLAGHVYVLARGSQGMVIYRTIAGGEVELVSDGDIDFSDDKWWDSACYYETIRAVADESSSALYVLGRASCGMVIYRVFEDKVTLISSCQIEFFDFYGWTSVNQYETIGAIVIDKVLYVYGRDACGVKVYRVTDGEATLVSDCQIEFSNGKWWDLVKYYSSIQGVQGVSGLAISGRSTCGVTIYDRVENGEPHTVAECI